MLFLSANVLVTERARSISPSKDSPASTPPLYKPGVTRPHTTDLDLTASKPVLSPGPVLRSPDQVSTREDVIDDAMERLTGEHSPTKENKPLLERDSKDTIDPGINRTSISRASPSSAMPSSRNSQLSWQRRPDSQASERARSRPLSMIATENAARSPRATPEPSPSKDDQIPLSREQIAQSLASKDPAWFRQTADRGASSPAYRKNQVEDANVVEIGSSSPRVQMPGMSMFNSPSDAELSSTPSRSSSSTTGTAPVSSSAGSLLPQITAQRFEPPGSQPNIRAESRSAESNRSLAMSPSQGRISPERLERSSSPTKGMGGFVQSAMMKRSDSVNKRWSVQSPPGLSRGNSVASNRSSHDLSAGLGIGGIINPTARDPRPSSLSRDNSPLPLSRPSSSHSNSTAVQDGDRPGTSSSMRSSVTNSTTNDGFVKPSFPASRSAQSQDKESPKLETTPPTSPAKSRWSPTKSSWLESALNKPESPKPRPTPPPQQPAWMSEINKAKLRGETESTRSPISAPKHEVNIGGLLRSPPMGGAAKPLSIGGLPGGFSSGTNTRSHLPSDPAAPIQPRKTGPSTQDSSIQPVESRAEKTVGTSTATSTIRGTQSWKESSAVSPAVSKTKPETPPKKDFRSNLKPRQLPSDNDKNAEPEFKNALGQLRRTKTQNYVAPDELKDNITRGKAGLNLTGGPKKTERKDEFKDAILKKKDDFKKAQLEGTGVKPTSVGSQGSSSVPEAIARKAALGRSTTVSAKELNVSKSPESSPAETLSWQRAARESPSPSLSQETSGPGRMQSKDPSAGSGLAARFNPALAGLLARGPPPPSGESSRITTSQSQRDKSVSAVMTNEDNQVAGPQLTHMTKARARGPKRKAPGSVPSTLQIPETNISPDPVQSKLISSPVTSKETLKSPFNKQTEIPPASISVRDEPENQGSQPSSPRKLDLKRRSKFLEEVNNKNEKTTTPQLETPKPQSTSKNANTTEISVKDERLTEQSETRPTPVAKTKPSSLANSPVLDRQFEKLSLGTPSPETARKLTPAPLSPIKSKSITSSEDIRSTSAVKQAIDRPSQNDSFTTARNATAMFGRGAASQPMQVKDPIKLPTHDDEEAAMIGAGLRSPDFGKRTTFNGANGQEQPSSPRPGRIVEPSQNPTRPLPTPPVKSPKISQKSIEPKTLSPKSPIIAAAPISEGSRLLTNFFGNKEPAPVFKVDTAGVLSANCDITPKIKTLRSQLYQLSADGKKLAVPNHQERILFESNMYICPHTFGTMTGKKIIEVYFWAGDNVAESSIEEAELFALREAKSAGGSLVKIRQGKETSEFIEALGGIAIIRRGSSNKYDSLAPHILCGRRWSNQIVFDEVEFSAASLCSGFPYLISAQNGKSYLWKGKGSGIDELSCARLIGMDFGLTGEIEEIEDGSEPSSFLAVFGNDAKITKSADHWRMKPNYTKYRARLFCAATGSKSQVQNLFARALSGTTDLEFKIVEVTPFSQADISPTNIYVLDAFFEIYIIVGSRSQTQYGAFCTSLQFAQEYGILAAGMEDRPFVPVSTVVLEGVPRDMKFVFRKWTDSLAPTIVHSPTTLSRGRSLRVMGLNAALDATRG
jgi:hypothetical protein